MVTELTWANEDPSYAKYVQQCWKGWVRGPRLRSHQPLPTRTGPAWQDFGPFLSMHYLNDSTAIPVGSADLNQGPTTSLTGRGDVRQIQLPNQKGSEKIYR